MVEVGPEDACVHRAPWKKWLERSSGEHGQLKQLSERVAEDVETSSRAWRACSRAADGGADVATEACVAGLSSAALFLGTGSSGIERDRELVRAAIVISRRALVASRSAIFFKRTSLASWSACEIVGEANWGW